MKQLKISVNVLLCLLTTIPSIAQADPIVSEDLVFEEKDGMVAVEAEHFFKQTKSDVRRWYRFSKTEAPSVGRDDDPSHCFGASNNAYLEILPDTRVTHDDALIGGENFEGLPGKMAFLHYKVFFNTPGRYYVWVRAFSTGAEDNGLHVGLDGEWPESGARLQWCEGKNTWRWESKQRTEEVHCGEPYLIYLDIREPGAHEIMFSMREDGFEFDKFLLTNDKNYSPGEGVGPGVIVRSGQLPDPFPEVGEETIPSPTSNHENSIPEIKGELKKWHKVTLTFEGPETSEDADLNPFMNYRFNVEFIHEVSGKRYLVPGYFAADGDAGNTSATSGNKWRVHFTPDEEGSWKFKADFVSGNYAAISDNPKTGQPAGFMHDASGTFDITKTDKSGRDFRSKGMLQYVGERYLKFAETGEYFLKVGSDAPENFLAYDEFDGTFQNDGHKDNLVKSWAAHEKHWNEGDPSWQNGKGKDIIGAVNYLASKGMNAFSFLTMNIGGDDQNVFPYVDYDTWDRMDCSKLDQWEIIFEHADQLGLFLHFKLMEMENQGLLDNGGIGAFTKLYYRELIARFGHHLAMNWNIGEENGDWGSPKTPPQFKWQRLSAAAYFADHDPYNHHIVIHNGNWFNDLYGHHSYYTGASLQTNNPDFRNVHARTLQILEESKAAGKQWAVACDEPGDAQHALLPDAENPEHNNARMNGLWGNFMAGGWGTEWYFGYKHAHSDLSCQDYSSRDKFWDQGKVALDFFWDNSIPFWNMENHNEFVLNEGDYVLAKPGEIYVFYLKKGTAKADLSSASGSLSVDWYDPRTGGRLQKGNKKTLKSGMEVDLGKPPYDEAKDWVVLLRVK
ncbi:DUF5060 domain-containing protein [Bacteroidota bacterium]